MRGGMHDIHGLSVLPALHEKQNNIATCIVIYVITLDGRDKWILVSF